MHLNQAKFAYLNQYMSDIFNARHWSSSIEIAKIWISTFLYKLHHFSDFQYFFADVVLVTLEYDEVLGGKNKVYILQYLQWVQRNFEKTFLHTVVNLLIGFQTTLNFIF